jgi:hypothetical protein
MDRSFVPSIVPNGCDQNFYLVINNYGNFGPAFAETDVSEADLETVIGDLMSGQYSDPYPRGRIQHRRTLVRGCLGRRRAGDSAPSRPCRS